MSPPSTLSTVPLLPMQEAQEFWADKIKLAPGQFNQLAAEAKVRAFAVSGIAKGAELTTVFDSLQKAIDTGISFDDFKKDCREIFARRGWTGKRAWRADNIFRTNIQTAYNVGRYQQMASVTDTFPYWMYDAVNDSRTRPTHLALDGKVFPAGHPFWDKWWPPNGFRCRCSVKPLTKSQVAERGLDVTQKDPTGSLILPVDPKTGLQMASPMQLLPDPGFAHHPGKSYWGGIVDEKMKNAWKYEDLPKLRPAADYGLRKLANIRPAAIGLLDEKMLLPKGLPDTEYLREFRARYGAETVLTDAAGEAVIFSERAFMVYKEEGAGLEWKFSKPGHGETIPLIGDMLANPLEIWLVPQKTSTGKIRLTRRYISAWKTADKTRIGGVAAFDVADGVFNAVSAFAPQKQGEWDLDYVERQRHGVLLYRKGGR